MVYVCWHIEREREVCLVLFVCETSPPGVDFNFFLKKSYKNYMGHFNNTQIYRSILKKNLR